jgi:hypothetical protein
MTLDIDEYLPDAFVDDAHDAMLSLFVNARTGWCSS